jgi:phosphoribosyl 1,2-cyclic phosphodiesterase
MNIRFWGVRGSIPTPLTPAQLRSKISSVVHRIGTDDIVTPESKEKFLSSLPEYLFGTIGGNTPCVEVSSPYTRGERIILDAGSGIRELGLSIRNEKLPAVTCHIMFSHFHWDHIQGLPFFDPAFNPSNRIHFYGRVNNLQGILESQMTPPTFPVTMQVMGAKKEFHVLGDAPFKIGGVGVSTRLMNHPGGSYAYAFDENGKKAIYSTDTELVPSDFEKTPSNRAFFENASVLIVDSQYTLGEAIEKYNWGHSAFSLAADFAASWNIEKLVLFHHEPKYDDKKIYGMLRSARWYVDHLEKKGLRVQLAV